ncbi:NAD-dependent SIR2 family protein deacetylase [Bosea sp. BE271]|uniref:hypothetical protein n=1 Tax=Bosea TaxID=85413 RepID=UPI0028668F86|nr:MULTISPECIES: hypothetical protein [Bosea]MDR6830734.1 NAD-dependent SIR2 family protein deacetylase [Bosea robiniae]MDR6897615.1 NAD-dependent SIR2 family protein deacetylase [Bosea sp. BE109]MDR7141012.1 NAD-dependent SIR2 family protein deacetylase [Bosea sp. BE168]MDR7177468.1 NAD-dependent SIR2 family protein deacetylase [Bosea sp. BE271]
MKMQKECAGCGAVYERTERKEAFHDKDSFHCQECGAFMERWNGSRIPKFKLISSPKKKGWT